MRTNIQKTQNSQTFWISLINGHHQTDEGGRIYLLFIAIRKGEKCVYMCNMSRMGLAMELEGCLCKFFFFLNIYFLMCLQVYI